MKITNSKAKDARALSDSDSDTGSSDDDFRAVALPSCSFHQSGSRRGSEDDTTRKRLDAASEVIDTSCDGSMISDESLKQFTYQDTQFKKRYDEIMEAVARDLPRIDLELSDDEDKDELYLPTDVRHCSPESVRLILNNSCDRDCICGNNLANHYTSEKSELDGKQSIPLHQGHKICEKNQNRQIMQRETGLKEADFDENLWKASGKSFEIYEKIGNRSIMDLKSSRMDSGSCFEQSDCRISELNDGYRGSRHKFSDSEKRTSSKSDTMGTGVRNSENIAGKSERTGKNCRNKALVYKGRSRMADDARRLVDDYMSNCPITLSFDSMEFAGWLEGVRWNDSISHTTQNPFTLSQGDTGAQPSSFTVGEDCTLIQRLARFAAEASAATGMNRIDPITGALRPEAAAGMDHIEPVTGALRPESSPLSSASANRNAQSSEAMRLMSSVANQNACGSEAHSLVSSVANLNTDSAATSSPEQLLTNNSSSLNQYSAFKSNRPITTSSKGTNDFCG